MDVDSIVDGWRSKGMTVHKVGICHGQHVWHCWLVAHTGHNDHTRPRVTSVSRHAASRSLFSIFSSCVSGLV